jgi:hypothetical protein
VRGVEPSFSPTLRAHIGPIDWASAQATPLRPGDSTDPMAWTMTAFGHMPKFMSVLLRIRNVLVKPFKLKTGLSDNEGSPFPTFFPIVAQTDDEVVLGASDSHLDFVASVRVVGKDAVILTAVHINNRFGRLYMAVIRPFHAVLTRLQIAGIGPVA